MHHQLRLAEREGLLSGPGLSPVQHFALVVLEYVERVEKWKREDRELRLAMLSAGAVSPDKLFPEVFGEPDDEEEFFPENAQTGETPEIRYVFADNATPDQQSIEEELRQLAANAAKGTATFDNTFSEWI